MPSVGWWRIYRYISISHAALARKSEEALSQCMLQLRRPIPSLQLLDVGNKTSQCMSCYIRWRDKLQNHLSLHRLHRPHAWNLHAKQSLVKNISSLRAHRPCLTDFLSSSPYILKKTQVSTSGSSGSKTIRQTSQSTKSPRCSNKQCHKGPSFPLSLDTHTQQSIAIQISPEGWLEHVSVERSKPL